MDLKIELKNRRKELGLTMLEVAQKVGVSEGTVSRWESGDIANMRRDKIVLLAKALQLSPAFIMGWEDEDNLEPTTTLPRQTGEHLFLSPTQQKILSNCQQLNETGQKKVLDFSDDLVSTEKYKSIGREPGYKLVALGGIATEGDDQPPIEERTTLK